MTTQTSNSPELQLREKRSVSAEGTRPGPVFRPDIDILERGDAYVVYADLPGADESSVDVRLDKGTLSLSAQLATEADPSWNLLHREYRVGQFQREFRLSEDIDLSRVSARMQRGVLELTLPKSAESQPRSIAIQAG